MIYANGVAVKQILILPLESALEMPVSARPENEGLAGIVQHPDARAGFHPPDHRDRQAAQFALPRRRHGEQQLVVLAAGENRLQPLGIAGQDRSGRRRERYLRRLDDGAQPRGRGDMGEVSGKPVGDIHAG